MNPRYSARDLGLELLFVALGAIALFPIYILVVVAFKSPAGVAMTAT